MTRVHLSLQLMSGCLPSSSASQQETGSGRESTRSGEPERERDGPWDKMAFRFSD